MLLLHFLVVGNGNGFLLLANRIKPQLGVELIYKGIFLLRGAQVPDHPMKVIFVPSVSNIQSFVLFQTAF